MNIKLVLFLSLVFVSNMSYSSNDVLVFHCPESLRIGQKVSEIKDMPDWVANETNKLHNYVRTWLSTNPGESKFRLRPDREKTAKNVVVEQYDLVFYRNKGQELHVVCEFTQSTASISRKIPDEYKYCDISFEKHVGLHTDKGVSCRKSNN